MKNLVIIILLALTVSTYAQSISSIKIENQVTVIDPIKLTKSVDLNFGNIVSGYNQGSVTLTPNRERTANGLQLSNTIKSKVSPAEAIVSYGNHSYSISCLRPFN